MLAVVLVVGGWLGVGQTPAMAEHGNCDVSYPDFCMPTFDRFGDVDCPEVQYGSFRVLAPDPHGLDGPDTPGVACETNPERAPASRSLAALAAAHGVSPQVSTTLGSAATTSTPRATTTAPTTTTTRAATAPTTKAPLVNTGSTSGPLSLTGVALVLFGVGIVRAVRQRRINGPYRIRYR